MFSGANGYEIQFLGGPLDGHRDIVPRDRIKLTEVAAIPINENLLSALCGERREQKSLATSVAVYELSIVKGLVCYQFIGATSTQAFRMENWTG